MIDHTANLRFLKSFGFLLTVFGSAFSNSVCGIGLGVYVGALLLQVLMDRTYAWRPYPAKWLLAALLVSLLVSVVQSDDFWTSARGFGKYLQGFALLYAALDIIREEKNKRAFICVLLLGWLLSALSGIYQEFFGVDFVRGFKTNIYQGDITRLTGTFKHCNDYGTFLAPGIVFGVAHLIHLARQKKWGASLLGIIFLAVMSYVFMRTLSRSAILSAFAGLFFFCLFFRFRWHALLGLAVTLAVLWWVPSPLRDRLHELTSFAGGEMSERMILLRTSVAMIKESPLFGLGLNTYSDHFPKFKPADYPALMYAHNTYLQMAAECGLAGLTLFLGFIATVMARASKKNDFLGTALLAGAFCILVNGLFDSVLQSTQLRQFFWILLGSSLALARL